MKEKIQINKDLHFGYEDLMIPVDFDDTTFTLRDVLRATMQSKIPLDVIKKMICPWVEDYWNEAESKPYEKDEQIEYLELYLFGDVYGKDDTSQDWFSWGFHGRGKEGVISDDLISHYPKEETLKMISEGYRENYALDFSPMYKIADLEVKVARKIFVTLYQEDYRVEKIKIRPTINLFDLLVNVYWEISFMGKPKDRNKQVEKLQKSTDEIEKWGREGTLNDHTYSFEEVKEMFKKKNDLEG